MNSNIWPSNEQLILIGGMLWDFFLKYSVAIVLIGVCSFVAHRYLSKLGAKISRYETEYKNTDLYIKLTAIVRGLHQSEKLGLVSSGFVVLFAFTISLIAGSNDNGAQTTGLYINAPTAICFALYIIALVSAVSRMMTARQFYKIF